ncbi:MAG: hypothetical protein MR590_02930 [Clostridiales bacterium]|nr:hypothetical protein [Clostridiales bacterium]
MFKKLTSLSLAIILCLLCCIPAFAGNELEVRQEDNMKYTISYSDGRNMTEKEREEAFREYVSAVEASVLAAHGNLGELRTEYAETIIKDVTGYPDQNEGGYSFWPKGYLYLLDEGGPKSSLSVSFTLNGFFSIGVSVPLGEIVEERVGTACEIPGSPRGQEVYYKVFETKRVEIRPFVIYWRENAFEPWQTFEAAADVKTIRIRLEAVRVDA